MNATPPKYMHIKRIPFDLSQPVVLGIDNVTPDSFFYGSRAQTENEIITRIQTLIDQGTAIIDLGAYSSRRGADDISADEEMARLRTGLELLRRHFPDVPVSIDTFRADVAERCIVDYGADIINDISGGEGDARMFETVARLQVPYVLMHMQGTPQTMQAAPSYTNFIEEVFAYFAKRIDQLRPLCSRDILFAPGFGCG